MEGALRFRAEAIGNHKRHLGGELLLVQSIDGRLKLREKMKEIARNCEISAKEC